MHIDYLFLLRGIQWGHSFFVVKKRDGQTDRQNNFLLVKNMMDKQLDSQG